MSLIPPLTLHLPNASATHRLGDLLGQLLPAGTILLLEGNLGSGKTTLTQGIGQGLGITEPIVSPTFTLLNEYPEGRIPLYHFDLYRLDPAEVDALNPEVYWDSNEFPIGIVVIEWAERLPEVPANYLRVQLRSTAEEGAAESGRTVQIEAIGAGSLAWLQLVKDKMSQL